MKTFRELYCAACRCREEDFSRRVFWRCLHRAALPFAPALLVANRDYFAPDRELIEDVGRARSWREFHDEVSGYVMDARNAGWWRRRAHVRISTHRLQRLAKFYFEARAATPARATRA